MRAASLVVLVALLTPSAMTQSNLETRFEARVYEDGTGESLLYRLFRPANYTPANEYPLVIYLHGGGGRGSDNLKQLQGGNAWAARLFSSHSVQTSQPSFVVAPQIDPPRGAGDGWGGGKKPARNEWDRATTNVKFTPERTREPIDLLVRLVKSLATEFSFDTQRIYVTGQSMGGYGTWALVTRYPEIFAAAVPVCGGGDPGAADRIEAAVWAFHGDADSAVAVHQSRMMIEALNSAGKNPRYTELKGVAHNSWEKAYSDPGLIAWLFAQRRQ